jgi:uncharacterized membrane protein YjjB (DUF3815 family)
MFTGHLKGTVAAALAGSVAWAAYKSGGALLAGAWLALFCVGLIGAFWIHAYRKSADVFHDPAVSTLVFPPESKFQSSVMPRH